MSAFVTAVMPAITFGQSGITPEAKEVLDRHAAAVGAARTPPAFEHVIAVLEMPGNQEMLIETFRTGSKVVSRTTTPGMGTTEVATDGTIAWQVSDMLGVKLLPRDSVPKSLAEERSAVVHAGTKALVAGSATVNGKETTAIYFAASAAGGSAYVQYYDMESGLLVAQSPKYYPFRVDSIGLMTFTDYRKFGSTLRPATTTIVGSPGQRVVMRIVSLDYDPIDASVFEIPASVKALLNPF